MQYGRNNNAPRAPRRRLSAATAGLAMMAVAGIVAVGPGSPANAKPSIESVQGRVDKLYREAEQASERYNDAKLALRGLRSDLTVLRAEQRRQGVKVEAVREQVRDTVVHQYEGQDLSAVGQVVVADDPTAFLSKLSTMSSYNDLQQQLYATYATQAEALGIRTDATARRVDQIAAKQAELAKEKKAVASKLAQAKSLLSELQEQQREEILSRGEVRVPSDIPVSGRASAAVQYALAQVHDAYVYGAAGPNAYDCSGLTMMAWAQAGVSLPHSSSAQYSMGPHIAESDLRPGDLVFYYSPISHVGMYIGNGLIVNAENPSAGVRITSLHAMPYVGAVRPG